MSEFKGRQRCARRISVGRNSAESTANGEVVDANESERGENDCLRGIGAIDPLPKALSQLPRSRIANSSRQNIQPKKRAFQQNRTKLRHAVRNNRAAPTDRLRLGAAHFLMKTREHVSTEMSLHVLAYNLRRVMGILGTAAMMQKMRA